MTDTTMTVRSELFRLSSVLDLDCYYDINDMSEEDCVELLGGAMRSIERLKYENQHQTSQEKPKNDNTSSDKKLMKKAKTLEEELKLSLNIVEDVGALKAKNLKLMTNLKKEKEQRSVMEDFIASQNKKIKILVEHIEKLMKALKIESAAKVRGLDDNRVMQKEQVVLKTRLEKQDRVMATQLRSVYYTNLLRYFYSVCCRLIRQVTEGSKILEDQLLLMDEKYVDLRTKLDINRSQLQTQIAKVRKEMDTLRLKYSLANGGALLDNVSVKKYQQQTEYGTGTIGFDITHTDGFTQNGNPPYNTSGNEQDHSPTHKRNPAKIRPVSAYASSSPQNHPSSSGQNPAVDAFNSQQMHPTIQPGGKIRPHTGTATNRQQHQNNHLNLTAPVTTGTPVNSSKVFNNYSRTSQYNTGELNLDKVVKKISRKQKLSRTDSWAPQDIQDLLNG
jgi:hypothetical protein